MALLYQKKVPRATCENFLSGQDKAMDGKRELQQVLRSVSTVASPGASPTGIACRTGPTKI